MEPTDHGYIADEPHAALKAAADSLMRRYGRSGSGRASALRLLGAYVIYQQDGAGGLRRMGFSRDSIVLYLDKLRDAGLLGIR